MSVKLKTLPPHFTYAVAIVVAAMVLGGSYVYTKNQERELKNRQTIEDSLDESAASIKREENLIDCIEKAEDDYDSTFTLNSDPAPESGEGVRQWRSNALSSKADEQLRSDKELCAKLYGN